MFIYEENDLVMVMLKNMFSFRSHEVALTKGLLEGCKVHVTKKVKPEPSQMKGTNCNHNFKELLNTLSVFKWLSNLYGSVFSFSGSY